MRCLLSGNDFSGDPEALGCHAHTGDLLILSTHNTVALEEHYVQGERYHGAPS